MVDSNKGVNIIIEIILTIIKNNFLIGSCLNINLLIKLHFLGLVYS